VFPVASRAESIPVRPDALFDSLFSFIPLCQHSHCSHVFLLKQQGAPVYLFRLNRSRIRPPIQTSPVRELSSAFLPFELHGHRSFQLHCPSLSFRVGLEKSVSFGATWYFVGEAGVLFVSPDPFPETHSFELILPTELFPSSEDISFNIPVVLLRLVLSAPGVSALPALSFLLQNEFPLFFFFRSP